MDERKREDEESQSSGCFFEKRRGCGALDVYGNLVGLCESVRVCWEWGV